MIKIILVALLIICAVSKSAQLVAQEVISDSLVHERIEYIQQVLNKSKVGVNHWWYGWLGLYSVATVGQGAVYLLSNDVRTKQDMSLGAGTTVLGAALQVLTPLNTGRNATSLAKLPESTTEEKLTKLAKAEELFKSDALTEKAGRSWQIHALNEAVNLGSGLITWLAYKRSVWDGLTCFLMNSAITETQIWTQPTRTLKDYQNYCRKYKSGNNSFANQPQPEYYLRTSATGVSFTIVF
jgi:hypothetical protein